MENKKLDPRVRFQHAKFTRKLSDARNYKRVPKARSENRVEASLQKVGLASLIAQLLIAAGLIAVAFLLYVPNPLFVKTITVAGLSNENRSLAQQAVDEYQKSRPWYIPAYNSLFFDANGVAEAIAKKVPAVSRITSAHESLWSKTAAIELVEKYERYAVYRPNDKLILYNDGTIKNILPGEPTALPQSGALVTLNVNHAAEVQPGDLYLNSNLLKLIEDSATDFPRETSQNFSYFEVKLPEGDATTTSKFTESWKEASLNAVLIKKAGSGKLNPTDLRIVLEPSMDIANTADKLKLLLDQTTPDRYRALYYVDLRLPNRAYLCLINTPCETN